MTKTRWLVALAVLCLVVAAAAVAYAAGKAKPAVPVQEVVAAQQFRLVDSGGLVRATLGLIPAPDGPPALVLWDRQKVQRAALTLGADGSPMLVLADARKHSRASLSVMKDGTASLALSDEGRQPRAFLVVMPDGEASLTLFDERGRKTWASPR